HREQAGRTQPRRRAGESAGGAAGPLARRAARHPVPDFQRERAGRDRLNGTRPLSAAGGSRSRPSALWLNRAEATAPHQGQKPMSKLVEKIKALRAAQATQLDSYEALSQKALDEDRAPTEDELTTRSALKADLERTKGEIERLEDERILSTRAVPAVVPPGP